MFDNLTQKLQRKTRSICPENFTGEPGKGGSMPVEEGIAAHQASRLGVGAANAVLKGNFGTMVSLRGTDIVLLPLEAALQERKCVPRDLYETAQMFMR